MSTPSDPVRIVDFEGNANSPANPIYVAGGSGGSWFSDATAANQQIQIARAETANALLTAIQNAINALDLNQDSVITILGNLLAELGLKADLTDTQPVSVASLPLPAGAATDTRLVDIIDALGIIQSRLTELTDPTDTQPVSFPSMPLPDGAATETTLLAVLTDMGDILTSLGFVLTRLNILTDPSDTQPISAASLPLPTGAATEVSLGSIITALGDMLTRLNALSEQATQADILTRLNAMTDPLDTQPVSVASLPLPPDAATETGLALLYDALQDILTRLNALTDPADTQPISAASLPLPDGAATLTAQTLGNGYLEDIATALGIPATDTALELLASILAAMPGVGGGGYASETTALAILDALGTPTPDDIITILSTIAAGGPGGYATEATAQDILTRLLGLTDPSDTQPVSAVALPLPTGAATEVTLAGLLTELEGKANLTDTQPISAAALPLPTGAATESRQVDTIEQIGEVQANPTANTVLDRLKVVADKVQELIDTGIGGTVDIGSLPLPPDASTETTLAAVLAALGDIFTRLQNMTDPADTQPVSAAALPLPTGAATEATVATLALETTQQDVLLALAAIVGELGDILTRLDVLTDPSDTQPISAVSLPLPTGASTSANQTDLLSRVGEVQANPTVNTVLDRLKALATGQGTLATEASLAEALGSLSDIYERLTLLAALTDTQPVSVATLPLPTGAATEASLASVDGKLPAQVGGRVPVDGSGVTQPVSAAALPLPTGAATAANQASELAAIGEVQATPTEYTLLRRLKDLYDLQAAATQTAEVFSDTNTAAIAATHTASQLCHVKSVTLHLDAAPTTPEDLTITVDYSGLGAAYDTVIFRLDLVGAVDLIWQPDQPLMLRAGDALKIGWPNTDTVTWGLTTLMGVI